ncbi:phosphoribosylamine--glycine ligase [Virgibacillus soli]
MKVFVVGRGGREHSIVKKLAESKSIRDLFVAPGNVGMKEAVHVPIDEQDIDGLLAFAIENKIDYTIVGPENPLQLGIANRFIENNLTIFAPTKEAALLESSKEFAKAFMKRHHIPTAAYETFTDIEAAREYIKEKGAPIVIKADGLAAGKGVVVAQTEGEAFAAVDAMLVNKKFGDAGETIVIEEFMEGTEFTLMAFVHRDNVFPMVPARDHKRAFDYDKGPNTGGMGAYAPVADITDDIVSFVTKEVIQKTATKMVQEGHPFTGILYAGMMMTAEGPKVIEFNTRFGDPETQVVLPLLKNDLLQVMIDVQKGKNPQLNWRDEYCVGVVLAASGYPTETYKKDILLPQFKGNIFTVYAGVDALNEKMVSAGGRIMLVGSTGKTMMEASEKVYQSMEQTEVSEDIFYRRDIGGLLYPVL